MRDPAIDPNFYIASKDAEWVRRWEEREQTFRKDIETNRAEYDRRMKVMDDYVKKFDRKLHEQQRVILKIRDVPVVGKYVVRWAGYTE